MERYIAAIMPVMAQLDIFIWYTMAYEKMSATRTRRWHLNSTCKRFGIQEYIVQKEYLESEIIFNCSNAVNFESLTFVSLTAPNIRHMTDHASHRQDVCF